jgi:hypothetical protein
MKFLLAIDSKTTASTHNHHLRSLPRRTPTGMQKKREQPNHQDDTHKKAVLNIYVLLVLN